MKKLKTIQYSHDKLNAKIKKHYTEIGVFEYSESKYDDSEDIKEEFKFEFTDVDLNETGNYSFLIVYCLDYTPVVDLGSTIVYQIDSKGREIEEVNLTLKTVNFNPKKEILYKVISDITDKQDKKDDENGYKEEPDYDSLKGGRDYENDLKNTE